MRLFATRRVQGWGSGFSEEKRRNGWSALGLGRWGRACFGFLVWNRRWTRMNAGREKIELLDGVRFFASLRMTRDAQNDG